MSLAYYKKSSMSSRAIIWVRRSSSPRGGFTACLLPDRQVTMTYQPLTFNLKICSDHSIYRWESFVSHSTVARVSRGTPVWLEEVWSLLLEPRLECGHQQIEHRELIPVFARTQEQRNWKKCRLLYSYIVDTRASPPKYTRKKTSSTSRSKLEFWILRIVSFWQVTFSLQSV